MHRSIEVLAPASQIESIILAIKDHPQVMGLTHSVGSSIKPTGDSLQIQVLNKGADDVLKAIRRYTTGSSTSIVTTETASISVVAEQDKINRDIDEAIWEEMETGLRLNGRITPNFLILMTIGGVITAIGFASFLQMQVVAFIAASIIAPGLEPIAALPFGIVHKNKSLVYSGLLATVAGYLLLMASAAITFLFLIGVKEADGETFLTNEVTKSLLGVKWMDVVLSFAAAAASIVMYLSYRRQVIAGPLIALILIPATAAGAICLVIGKWRESAELLAKAGMEIGIIVLIGSLLIYLKQKSLHKRAPMR